MTTDAAARLLPDLWKSTLLSGILAVILGALVVFLPGESVLTAAILFGIYLLVTGIAQVVFAFGLPVSAGGRVLLFVSGAASLILGVLAFRQLGHDKLTIIWLLAIWIAVGFIFRGVATTVSAISDPDMPGRGWEIFFGVVSLLAGLVVLASPLDSMFLLATVIGIWLIVVGVFEIVTALGLRKAANRIKDFVDEKSAVKDERADD
jgi:uncharacterized membrane protein HdeD (DUF308 family)